MAALSKPVLGALAVLLIAGGFFYFQSDPPAVTPVKAKLRPQVKADEDDVPDFLPEDFVKRFDHPKPVSRNIFLAPVAPSSSLAILNKGILDKVPSELAGGDGAWIFTGVATLDGQRMALLENGTSHQGAYVTEGSVWKSAKIKRISSDGIAFAPKSGGQELIVFRYKPPLAAVANAIPPAAPTLPPAEGIQPINPANMSGSIGGGMIIHRSRRSFSNGVVVQAGTP